MRDIKTLMSSTVETCVTSHGLTPMTLTAKTSDRKLLSIPFSESSATITELTQPAPTGSRAKALFLLDHFAVSDEFYHELAQVSTLQSTVRQKLHDLDTDISGNATSLPNQGSAKGYEQRDRNSQSPTVLCREVHESEEHSGKDPWRDGEKNIILLPLHTLLSPFSWKNLEYRHHHLLSLSSFLEMVRSLHHLPPWYF